MLPDVAPHSEAAQRLASAVQLKLTALLGDAYSDNSLAEYIVMMVAHKTQQAQMAENLMEFLGRDADHLAAWLYSSLPSLLQPPDRAGDLDRGRAPHREAGPRGGFSQQQQQQQQQQQPGARDRDRHAAARQSGEEAYAARGRLGAAPSRAPAAAPPPRQVMPWERPSQTDRELQRQQQEAAWAAARRPALASVVVKPEYLLDYDVPMEDLGPGILGMTVTVAAAAAAPPQPAPAPAPGGHAPLLHDAELRGVLRGRLLQLEAELPVAGAAAAPGAQDSRPRAVLVSNLPPARRRVVMAHFAVVGWVTRLSLLKDPATGRPSGLAWVEYATPEDAARALALEGSTLLLHPLRVRLKDSEEGVAAVVGMNAGAPPLEPPPGLGFGLKGGKAAGGKRLGAIKKEKGGAAIGGVRGRSFKFVRGGVGKPGRAAKGAAK